MEFHNNHSVQSSEMDELEFVEMSSERHRNSSYMNDFKEIFDNAKAHGKKLMNGGDDRTYFEPEYRRKHRGGADEEEEEKEEADVAEDNYNLDYPEDYDELRKRKHRGGNGDYDNEDYDELRKRKHRGGNGDYDVDYPGDYDLRKKKQRGGEDDYDTNFPDDYELRKKKQRGGEDDYGNGVEVDDNGDLEYEPTRYNDNQQEYEFQKNMLLNRIGSKMVGGKKELPVAMKKMIELSAIIRNSGPYPGINLIGVSKVIWDDAISKLGGNSSDVNKIMAIATKSAEKPHIFIEKYKKMYDIGDSVLKAGTFKAVKPMDIGKLVWDEASKQAGSGASAHEIEKIAKGLIEKKDKSHYVDLFKKNKKAGIKK